MANHVGTIWSLIQGLLVAKLKAARGGITHATGKGDATENTWVSLLASHLPHRYQVNKAYVIDSTGAQSQQMDVVIYDRQYTPLLADIEGEIFVPAESVYAVFEVKQEMDAGYVAYAGEKIESVRNLHRTSTDVISVGQTQSARTITPILGGLLTSESSWNPPFGKPFKTAINNLTGNKRIDLGVAAKHGSFEVSYQTGVDAEINLAEGELSLLAFFFNLLQRLQTLGTVAAIDYDEYIKLLR